MKFLKGCALTILSFILFISLCVFGIVYTINRTAFNPHFVNKAIAQVDFSQAVRENLNTNNNNSDEMSPELQSAIVETVNNVQPVLKQRLGIAIDETYAYLKGKNYPDGINTIAQDSVMNSQFVTDLLANVDISELLEQSMKAQGDVSGFEGAFQNSFITTVDKSEPEIKKQLITAADPVFSYLLLKNQDFDLKSTLRQTLLSDSLIKTVIDNLDFTVLTQQILSEDIGTRLPQDIILSSTQTDQLAAALSSTVQTSLADGAADIADYLTGIKPDFKIIISLAPVMPTLKTVTRAAFLAQLPPDLQGSSQSEIDAAFDQYYADFSQTIPAVYAVNSGLLGEGIASDITKAVADAQNNLSDAKDQLNNPDSDFRNTLKEVRKGVGYFRAGFLALIALLVLAAGLIVLIYRNVKGSCLHLGIIFTVYGVIELVAALVAKSVVSSLIPGMDVSAAFSNLPAWGLNAVTGALIAISIIGLVLGILLIAASIIYPRMKTAKPENKREANQ